MQVSQQRGAGGPKTAAAAGAAHTLDVKGLGGTAVNGPVRVTADISGTEKADSKYGVAKAASAGGSLAGWVIGGPHTRDSGHGTTVGSSDGKQLTHTGHTNAAQRGYSNAGDAKDSGPTSGKLFTAPTTQQQATAAGALQPGTQSKPQQKASRGEQSQEQQGFTEPQPHLNKRKLCVGSITQGARAPPASPAGAAAAAAAMDDDGHEVQEETQSFGSHEVNSDESQSDGDSEEEEDDAVGRAYDAELMAKVTAIGDGHALLHAKVDVIVDALRRAGILPAK